MNDNIAEGRWKRIRGSAQEQLDILTGDGLDRTEGKIEKLAGTLQEKYGRARTKADNKIERRLRDHGQKYIAVAIRAMRINMRQPIGW